MPGPYADTLVDELAQSLDRGRAALELLAEYSIPPTPPRYAVAFVYQSRQMPDVNAAIGALIERNRLGPVTIDDVYDRIFGQHLSQEELRDAGRQMQDTVSTVVGILGDANVKARQYGSALADFSSHAKVGSPELDAAVSGILDQTHLMEDANRALEAKLLASSREVERLRQRLERVEHESTLDPLTGIGNRRRFDHTLREACDFARRDQRPVSLLMVDIDHFKRFNDTYGHQMGDQVLKLVARYMTESIREEDLAARYGGEEFGVILPGTQLTKAVEVGNLIRERVCNRKVINRKTGQSMGQITLSVGAAQFREGDEGSTLIERADEALYLAKNTGRNKVVAETELGAKKW